MILPFLLRFRCCQSTLMRSPQRPCNLLLPAPYPRDKVCLDAESVCDHYAYRIGPALSPNGFPRSFLVFAQSVVCSELHRPTQSALKMHECTATRSSAACRNESPTTRAVEAYPLIPALQQDAERYLSGHLVPLGVSCFPHNPEGTASYTLDSAP